MSVCVGPQGTDKSIFSQVKSVKPCLKQLQQCIQTISTLHDDEILPSNPADLFHWLPKEHMCVLVYLVRPLFLYSHIKNFKLISMKTRQSGWYGHISLGVSYLQSKEQNFKCANKCDKTQTLTSTSWDQRFDHVVPSKCFKFIHTSFIDPHLSNKRRNQCRSGLKIWAAQYIENLSSLQYQYPQYTYSRELLVVYNDSVVFGKSDGTSQPSGPPPM